MVATAGKGEAAAAKTAKFDRLHLPEERDKATYYGHIPYKTTATQLQLMRHFRQMVLEGRREDVLSTLNDILPSHEIELRHLSGLLMKRENPEKTKEALLSAITLESRPLVELILQLFVDFPHEERSGCTNCPMFAPHMTPLMLACTMNNFAIVESLLLRGHTISIPHHAYCSCETCHVVAETNIEHMRRVDVYRAISSEAYLWLATPDPFVAACSLSEDFEQAIADDNVEFVDVYNQLHQNVQNFAVRLVEQCWNVEEVDLFLSQRSFTYLTNCQQAYPRVRMALDAGLKDFAASVPVQRACTTIWYKGWGHFGNNTGRDAFRILRHIFLWPILAPLYIFTNGKIGTGFDVPMARYISYMSSYVVFLACLIGIRYARKGTDVYDRDMLNPIWNLLMELYTFLYVMGLSLERYLEFSRRGVSGYFSLWWRWFDFVFLGIFMLAFHIWLTSLCINFQEPDTMKVLHRRHWPLSDYFLLYDIFLAFGCILAFWRTFYFFQLMKGFGATIISIGRCVSQIYSYLFVMGIIMFAFAIGLNILNSPYQHYNAAGEENGNHLFRTIPQGFRHLYWAFYGYMDPKETTPNEVGKVGPEQEKVENIITSGATEGIVMLYYAVLVITLLNLMISLLVKKADEVLDNEDLEFKYTRAAIYSEYFEASASVPPPFNILHWFVRPIFCISSGEYLCHWPEFYVKKELLKPSEAVLQEKRYAYENLLVIMFKRFRATRECVYKSAFRANLSKEKNEGPPAKIVFMNDT